MFWDIQLSSVETDPIVIDGRVVKQYRYTASLWLQQNGRHSCLMTGYGLSLVDIAMAQESAVQGLCEVAERLGDDIAMSLNLERIDREIVMGANRIFSVPWMVPVLCG